MVGRGVVLSLFSFLGLILFLTAVCGRKYIKSGTGGKERDDRFLDSHVVCAKGGFILTIIAVASVELLKRLGGPIGGGITLSVHLVSAISFFFLFVFLLFLVTGIRAPKYHRMLAYPCLVFFVITFLAGASMLLGIAPKFFP